MTAYPKDPAEQVLVSFIFVNKNNKDTNDEPPSAHRRDLNLNCIECPMKLAQSRKTNQKNSGAEEPRVAVKPLYKKIKEKVYVFKMPKSGLFWAFFISSINGRIKGPSTFEVFIPHFHINNSYMPNWPYGRIPIFLQRIPDKLTIGGWENIVPRHPFPALEAWQMRCPHLTWYNSQNFNRIMESSTLSTPSKYSLDSSERVLAQTWNLTIFFSRPVLAVAAVIKIACQVLQ
jgi:hypothetical protein